MNIMFNPIIFYSGAILLVLSSLFAINVKNIFYSLLSAILVFFITGFFFYILGSEYNAVIQIAIYGIAVPVILGLSIMFTNIKKHDKDNDNNLSIKYLSYFVGCLFILALIYLLMTASVLNLSIFNVTEQTLNNQTLVLQTISKGIFIKYVWAFELVSIILTIIVVGLTLFNNKNREVE